MPGIKGKGGVKGRSGRRGSEGGKRGTIYKTLPNLTCPESPYKDYGQPTTRHILDVEINSCSACGSHWWSDYRLIIRGQEQSEPDTNGDGFPVVDEISVKGQPERHFKGCPNK